MKFINIHIFGGFDFQHGPIIPVEKYSIQTNTQEILANICDDHFCACYIMDIDYVVGGHLEGGSTEFNTKNRL